MRFVVGGEAFDLTPEQVMASMKSVVAEPIRKHIVEVDGQVFPPKQVFARITGRDRLSFTTMEAQRVLTRLGFVCRTAGQLDDGKPAWVAAGGDVVATTSLEDRLGAVEATLATIEAAVAGLHVRMKDLEGGR